MHGSHSALPCLAITPGEPGGIGPEIVLKALSKPYNGAFLVVSDPHLLEAHATQLGLKNWVIEIQDPDAPIKPHRPGVIPVLPVPLKKKPHPPGTLYLENARYVLDTLETASALCQQQKCQGMVTGPVHKGIINSAGIPFKGHTQHLGQLANTPDPLMLFVTEKIKVALATTHIALSEVPKAITSDLLTEKITTLHRGLHQRFGIPHPHIIVCGLNPHAGENGFLGKEEIEIITPTLETLKREKDFDLTGPMGADVAFTPEQIKKADAILALYHDQGLPAVKYSGFNQAINVTLGLPFIRTSVDHGTALDIAGKNRADPGSMEAAIKLAFQLVHSMTQR